MHTYIYKQAYIHAYIHIHTYLSIHNYTYMSEYRALTRGNGATVLRDGVRSGVGTDDGVIYMRECESICGCMYVSFIH